jgi:outer membrane protein assembly factor BamB
MQKKFLWALCFAAGLCACVWAADWPSTGGNPQRDGWAQGETVLSKENIADKKIQLLYSYKFDNQAKGLADMGQPIVLSNIIGYQGFKQLLFVGGSSNAVFSLDADIGKPFFKTPLDPMDKTAGASATALCSGGLTATLAMPGQSRVGLRGGFAPSPAAARGRGAAAPGRAAAAPGRAPARGGRGGPAVFWAVSSDGYLRTLRQQDGNATWIAPTKFVPENSDVSGLNVDDNVIYAATENNCGGSPNGLYAALYTAPELPRMPGEPLVAPAKFDVVNFMTNGSGFSGPGGTTIATDGSMIYGQVAEGHGDVAGQYHDTMLALDPKTLEVKDYFTPSGSLPAIKKGIAAPGVTPAFFQLDGKDVVVAGGRDGRIYLLDASSPGGANHHTPLYASDPVVKPDSHYSGDGIWGTFATWEDTANNTRWLYAAIRGQTAMQFGGSNGSAATGAIVAFKVVDDGGKPSLSPQWISHDMISPAGPVTANGLVFALSTGMTPRVAKDNGMPYTVAEEEQMAKPAVLYILDGTTGQELLSSGSTATSFSTSGIAVANGRVYFTTHDNTLYAYGLPEER